MHTGVSAMFHVLLYAIRSDMYYACSVWAKYITMQPYTCSTCVLHMFYTCSTCILHVFYMCSRQVLHMFYMYSTYVLHMFYTCSTHVLHVFYMCSTHVLHMFYMCSTCVLHMFYTCSTHVLHMFYTCLHVFYTCSTPVLHILHMFYTCMQCKYGSMVEDNMKFHGSEATILTEAKPTSILLLKIHKTHIASHHWSIFDLLCVKCLWLKPINLLIPILLVHP